MTSADRDLAFPPPAGPDASGREGEILSALARGDRDAALRLLMRE